MSILSSTRRGFLKGALILTGGLMLSVRYTTKAIAAVLDIKDVMLKRITSVYAADDKFRLKASQDNAQVQMMYKQLYIKPLSESAEHNLHTKWFDRSESITELRKKGEFPNPRFKEFCNNPYPYDQA